MQLKMYINGKWYVPDNHSKRDVINPANGEVIAQAADGIAHDARKAIQAAREAFDNGKWANQINEVRSRILWQIADEIETKLDELSELEMLDNGKPLREAKIDVQGAADCFRYYASVVRQADGKTLRTADVLETVVIREPIGVCGLIVPWNYPLLMSVWKIAAALAAGNTIVFKPSEVTPVTAMKLFEIFAEAGLPEGVVNMVMGTGGVVGHEISSNHDVDMVSFTGGTDTGRQIMRASTGNLKKVSLELGGKSPNIIFADTDLDLAVDYALYGIYYGSGQVCSAASRILVEETMFDSFVDRFVERANKITVGPGNDPNTEMGPLVSEEHMKKVLEYIQIGKNEGAQLICGGNRITGNGLDKGYFVDPTVFVNVEQQMCIVQEEIFGPVVTIQKFAEEVEAIALANSTKYGLAGSVFTDDRSKALRVIRQIRSGITWINTYHETYYEAPWGGYKESGIGRSLGEQGLDEFSEIKQININAQPDNINWFQD